MSNCNRPAIGIDPAIIEGNPHFGDPEGLLFDLAASAEESENLRSARPELFEELRGLASDYEGSLTPGEPVHQETGERISPFPGDVEPFELTDEEQSELQALGYFFDDPPDS